MKIFTFSSANTRNIPPAINFFARSFLFVLGIAFILAVIFFGIVKVSQLCTPYLVVLANALIAIFLLVIIPLSFINKLRPILFVPTYFLSYLLGGCTWVYSLLYVVGNLGFWGILFCFFFQTLTPITLMGAIFKGAWDVVGMLLVWFIFTYLIRFFSFTLAIGFSRKKEESSHVIDVEARTKE
jgi:hypothetical protein